MSRRGAQDELRRHEEKRTELAARLERQEAALHAAQAAVSEARQAEAVARLDSPDPTGAREHRVAAEVALADATSELDILRREIEEQDRRVAAQRTEAHAERVAELTQKYRAQLQRDNKQAAALNATLEQARDQSIILDVARERADALLHELRALVDDPYFDPQVPEQDEPARPDGLEVLVAAIEAGARRPNESQVAGRQKAAEARARTDRQLVDQAVRNLRDISPATSPEQRQLYDAVLKRLPERLRAEVRERDEREHAERAANRLPAAAARG